MKTFASRFFKAALYAVLYFSNAQSIASSDRAAAEGRNRLTTGSLTQSDIQNRADYRGQSLGIGGGYQVGQPMVGLDQQGRAQTGAGQVPGTTLPTLGGFSAAPPIALSARDSADSVTRSGVSAATLDITDEKKQQALTGKDAPTTIASINRDVSTSRDTSSALKPIFNEQEIQAGFAITAAFSREVSTFLVHRAKDADFKTQAAKDKDQQADAKQAQAEALPDGAEKARLLREALTARNEAIAARIEAKEIDDKWGPGGSYRQVMTAITAAAGNVTASGSQFVQSAVVNLVQSKAALGIKQLTDELGIPEGSPAHAALHAINACVGAAAQGSNCGAAAVGAATASVVGALLAETQGGAEKLTREQKDARQALVTTLVTGVAAATGDAAAANTAALIEMENNANVRNAVKAAINDAKDYLGTKAKQSGEKLVQLLEKLDIKPMVEKKKEIEKYLTEAGARGGLTDTEIAVLGTLYAANELLFPINAIEVVLPGAGKVISKAGILIKAGRRAEDAAKVASAEVKAAEAATSSAKEVTTAIRGKTVLGNYPEYTQVAESLRARRFNIPEAVWNRMSEAERWAANQKFLDRLISRGDDIILATPLDKVRPGSYFARELEHMARRGYVPTADGTRLVKP